MNVSFANIPVGREYSRQDLARIWSCKSFHALARGVVTPRDDNKIILFVTEQKQSDSEPYDDLLTGNTLMWEGPNDHFAEARFLNAPANGDEIHLFHGYRHHTEFTYRGRLTLVSCEQMADRPSRFVFTLRT